MKGMWNIYVCIKWERPPSVSAASVSGGVIIVSGLYKCEKKRNEKIKKKGGKIARWQMKTMLMRIAVDVANEVAAETAANGG